MKSIFRVIVLIAVLLGTLGLAQKQVAWAADTPEATDPSISGKAGESVLLHYGDDCKDPRNKHRPKCYKDRIKDWLKKFCKKHPRLCGSILPPPHFLSIPVTGHYSVGGFCTLSIDVKDPGVLLEASVIDPDPGGFPERFRDVAQGCLLKYSSSNQPMDRLQASAGSTTICFASPPGERATVYRYDSDSVQPQWSSVDTTADVGKACAPANETGVYIASVAKP